MSVAEAVSGADTQTPPGDGTILRIVSLGEVDHITPANRAQMRGTYDGVTTRVLEYK